MKSMDVGNPKYAYNNIYILSLFVPNLISDNSWAYHATIMTHPYSFIRFFNIV